MDLVKALNSQYMKEELPEVKVGDTVRVHVRIKEGSRERIQVFEGTIIARKHGGIGETITVRRISYGVGCEKVFPVHSPRIAARLIAFVILWAIVYGIIALVQWIFVNWILILCILGGAVVIGGIIAIIALRE